MGVQGKLSRTSVIAVFALLFTLPVAAQSGHTRPVVNIKIDNFGRVNDNYYRGAQPGGRDYADLAAFGIKTVIDLRDDSERSEPSAVQSAGMKYVRIGMDTHINPTPEQLQQFLQIVNDPASQPVYVHCVGGRHRTGVMTAVYRMTNDGWTGTQAFKEMKNYHFGADFLHPEFKNFVFSYNPQVILASAPATVDTQTAATH